ncbi:MAG: large subunit ribosomal protein [Patescibacteria group bacterium]|jgi:large subunit ribosomal protein L23|nr:large subunit ribosomal protein [Patescibacteria group bacterium]
MGLFNKKDSAKAEETKDVVVPEVKAKAKTSKKAEGEVAFDSGSIIRNPRITEKAAYASDKNVYTFDIAPRASKIEIVKAIKSIYNVTPIKVNVTAIPTKRVVRKNTLGQKGGGKKAYVFLKKGDKIEFV